MPVRGFKRQNTRQSGPDRDALARFGVGSNRVAGAPVIPRARIPADLYQPYAPMPSTWPNSLLEWIVMDDLVRRRRFVLYTDFLFQAALTMPGLNKKGLNRADFTILGEGKNGVPDAMYPRGVVLNPYSSYTHPSIGKDKTERLLLGNAGFREVYLAEEDLMTRPHFVIGLGLRGIDVSDRGP